MANIATYSYAITCHIAKMFKYLNKIKIKINKYNK